jgi:TonB family protein
VALSALLATTSIFRSVPIMASVVMHAGVAATLIATGGHAPTRAASSIVETLDIDVATEAPVTPPAPEQETPSANVASAAPTPPTHTHPFPVDPSHDAHPHDPSQPHDHATPPDTHEHEEPAAAAPVTMSEAPLPRFTIPSGAAQNAPGGATSSASTGASTGSAPASAPADDAAVPASSVQVAAKLQSSVVAAYPVDARADDVEGDVQLEIVVDREGRVVEARVARPAGHGFDEAALQAIRRYRFSPAQREGHNVRVRMPWSVQFRLR